MAIRVLGRLGRRARENLVRAAPRHHGRRPHHPPPRLALSQSAVEAPLHPVGAAVGPRKPRENLEVAAHRTFNMARNGEQDAVIAMGALPLLFIIVPLLAFVVDQTMRSMAARSRRTFEMQRNYDEMHDETGNLETGVNVGHDEADAPVVAPTSPCFSSLPSDAGRRHLVLQAQRLVLAAFMKAELHGVIDMPVDGYDDGLHRSHQDAHGVLFASLLAVRRDAGLLAGAADLRPGLSARVRMRVAALVLATCKFHANTPSGDIRGLVALLRHFLAVHKPTTGDAWRTALDDYVAVEASVVLDTPLLCVAIANPLTHVETELCRMVRLPRGLSPTVAKAIRSAAFFVLGAALFNPVEDVLERMNTTHTTDEIGRAAVRLLLTSWYVSECSGLVHREPREPRVDGIVRVLVRNALSPHAGVLRVGNYTDVGSHCTVRRMVAPATLASVARIYGA